MSAIPTTTPATMPPITAPEGPDLDADANPVWLADGLFEPADGVEPPAVLVALGTVPVCVPTSVLVALGTVPVFVPT